MDDRKQDKEDELPPPVEMSQQEASYSSSYNETFPGQVEANRRNALSEEGEQDDDEARPQP